MPTDQIKLEVSNKMSLMTASFSTSSFPTKFSTGLIHHHWHLLWSGWSPCDPIPLYKNTVNLTASLRIHGGAYVTGNKIDSSAGDPSGLISASQKDGSDGFIYVSMNYRLGGLGFMSGELFESQGGIPNLGLYDQALALQWVQDHIHLFGGDKNQVTVSGGMLLMHLFFLLTDRRLTDSYITGSAGAGSIVHHLTSNGGRGEVPFQRTYIESPGLIPATPETQNAGAVDFLAALVVRSFAEARKMDSAQIIRANADVIYRAKTSSFKYSPQAGGSYVNTTAYTALRNGLVHADVDLLVSHTANEGVVFMPTYATTDALFTEYLTETFPNATEYQIRHIVDDLYPLSVYDGLWYERNTAFVGDYGLNCYTNALAHAYRGQTHNYEWDIFPALHGDDFLHAFFNGENPTGRVNATYAGVLQKYISNFVMAGNPNGDGLPVWPAEGSNFTVMAMTANGPNKQRDTTEGEKCAWLRQNELLS